MKKLIRYFFLILLVFIAFAGCKKEEDAPAEMETGIVTDVDGNTYKTVKIGNQWWMAENLKTTKYANGIAIQSVSNKTDWSLAAKGVFCSYDDNPDNIKTYGRLYNWFAINDSNKLAPIGWHIPSDNEWKILEMELGMSEAEANNFGWRGDKEGEKLKIEAPLGWTEVSPVWGTNSSSFTALAGACRLFNGTYGDPGLFATGFWWSASEHNADEAFYRHLDKKNANVFRSYTYKNYGFSVRCVKD